MDGANKNTPEPSADILFRSEIARTLLKRQQRIRWVARAFDLLAALCGIALLFYLIALTQIGAQSPFRYLWLCAPIGAMCLVFALLLDTMSLLLRTAAYTTEVTCRIVSATQFDDFHDDLDDMMFDAWNFPRPRGWHVYTCEECVSKYNNAIRSMETHLNATFTGATVCQTCGERHWRNLVATPDCSHCGAPLTKEQMAASSEPPH